MAEKDSTSITVIWHPVFGQITGYKLRYKKAGNGQYAFMEIISDWKSQFQEKITNLRKNTKYEIQVAAFTDDGIGPYSEGIIAKTTSGNLYLRFSADYKAACMY